MLTFVLTIIGCSGLMLMGAKQIFDGVTGIWNASKMRKKEMEAEEETKE